MPSSFLTNVGSYQLHQKLGQGSFGQVWLAEDYQKNHPVALKILHAPVCLGLDQLKNEFSLLCRLKHPHLASVYDYGFELSNKKYFFTSEYCDGKNLFDQCLNQSWEYITQVIVQILSVLDYVHGQGVIHFDIKNQNILIQNKNNIPHVKLVDFGLSTPKNLKKEEDKKIGTPVYMAPEVIVGSSFLDHRADLYSLGICCYYLLNRTWPFDPHEVEEVKKWHLKGNLPSSFLTNKQIPSYLKELTIQLLEKEPRKRFSSAQVALNFIHLATQGVYSSIKPLLVSYLPVQGPLIEREDSFDFLKAMFADIFLNNRHDETLKFLVNITGEPGSGKTRLLNEFQRYAELHEIKIRFLKEIKESQEALSENFSMPSSASENFLIKKKGDELIQDSKEEPFCLIVDDFSRENTDSVQLVHEIILRIKKETYEGTPPKIMILLAGENSLESDLVLERISEKGVFDYVRQLIGERDQNQIIANNLWEFSLGLPLLVVEGLHYLLTTQNFRDKIPFEKFTKIYLSRLHTLSSDARELLDLLGLIKDPCSLEEIQEVLSKWDFEKIHDNLLCLQKNYLVIKYSSSIYGLSSDALTQEVLAQCHQEKKKKWHLKIAENLKNIQINKRAFHFAGAGLKEKSIQLYMEAGNYYKKNGNLSLSISSYLAALDQMAEDNAQKEKILLELVRLLIHAGNYQEAEAKIRFFPDNHAPSLALKGWLYLRQRNFTTAQDCFIQSLKLLSQNQALESLNIKLALGGINLQTGQYAQAASHFMEALKDEQKLSDDQKKEIANNDLGLVLYLQNKPEEAISWMKNRLREEKNFSFSTRVSLHAGLGYLFIQTSAYKEGCDHLEEAIGLSEKNNLMFGIFSSMGNLFTGYLKQNFYTQALKLYAKMTDYQKRFGTLRDLAFNELRGISLYNLLGFQEVSKVLLDRGTKIGSSLDDHYLVLWFDLFRGYHQWLFKDFLSAEGIFKKLYIQASRENFRDLVNEALYALAKFYLDQKFYDECHEKIQLIKPEKSDNEFKIKLNLLKLELKICRNELAGLEEDITTLIQQCKTGNFLELLWEAYFVLALCYLNKNKRREYQNTLQQASDLLYTIASYLPEEYRERYLSQKFRQKIFHHLKEESSMLLPNHFISKLLEINKKIAGELHPQRLLELIMDAAIELSQVEEGMLLMIDGSGRLEPKVARNFERENLEAINFSQSVARGVIMEGKAVFSNKASEDQNFSAFESIVSHQIYSLACVPLKHFNKVVGLIYLATKQKGAYFNQELVGILEAFADQASIALKNAQTFTQTEEVVKTQEEQIHTLESLVSEQRDTPYPGSKIIGCSKKIQDLIKTMDKICNAMVAVYVYGETGTGKELIARALHENSIRKGKRFVAINCSAFSESILESELFGCMKGAFTGADRDKKGLFEIADGGSLFLDEVADMSLAMQAKILRVLQEQEVMRVGGREPIQIKTRIVSASNKNLRELVQQGKFREDLYYRLSGVTLSLPPLRERKEDIPLLVRHFLGKIKKENNLSYSLHIKKGALDKLLAHNWPGNIRELEQCLTSSCLLSEKGVVDASSLLINQHFYQSNLATLSPSSFCDFNPNLPLEGYEKEIIKKTLEYFKGNKSETAKHLGISRLTLHKKIKEYEITVSL